ncbi:hypothetical protein [Bosea sp. 124]|uniref:hypothetical protein n=1 Tax=Bosea sp. 124 TaxID=2135642 RepID=UPI000D3D664B|nr:hypothetical protein [Bosea sp. 124]PTM43538.1 hypothetical protein C8D03_5155 [Bosea sp. 124]
MPFDLPTKKPLAALLLLATLGVAAAGCAGEAGKVVAEAAGMATTPQESKPFVQETRPSDPAYMPIGRTFPVDPLCQGDGPAPPPFVPAGQAAHFTFTPESRKPNEGCKPRAAFKKIEAELDAKRLSNEAAGNQAKSLGATPPPKPATLPTN